MFNKKEAITMVKAKKIKGYSDTRQTREKLDLETYQYQMPFNYDNITVFRKFYDGGEFHGLELEPKNQPSARANVKCCEAKEWFKISTKVLVPPRAAVARFEFEVAGQSKNETLMIDDAFSCVLPGGTSKGDSPPKGTKNQLANAGFAREDKKTSLPTDWGFLTAGSGSASVTDKDSHSGRRSFQLKGVGGIALWQDTKVKEGQELYWSLWLKSSTSSPKCIHLFPKFYDQHGDVVSDTAGDCIVVREDKPIVRVVVIGSACTPPGYVQIECDEIESWRRPDELRTVMPVRFRINNLWGMHLRADQWGMPTKTRLKSEGGKPYEEISPELVNLYPGLCNYMVKSDYQEFPLAGMSSAIFEIPPSKKILIRGGSEIPGWSNDLAPNDIHYSFRMIRTTVSV
jgi:hypothetical protein